MLGMQRKKMKGYLTSRWHGKNRGVPHHCDSGEITVGCDKLLKYMCTSEMQNGDSWFSARLSHIPAGLLSTQRDRQTQSGNIPGDRQQIANCLPGHGILRRGHFHRSGEDACIPMGASKQQELLGAKRQSYNQVYGARGGAY